MFRATLDVDMKAARPMLTCKQASQLASQSLEQPLSWSNRMLLRLHFLMCGACRRFNLQLTLLAAAVKSIHIKAENDSAVKLSAAAKVRMTKAINHTLSSEINNLPNN
jgi:hypothetical protein